VGWWTPPLAQPVIARIEHLVEGDVVEKCHTDEMMPVGYDSKHGLCNRRALLLRCEWSLLARPGNGPGRRQSPLIGVNRKTFARSEPYRS
jgi:hypothetical protein